ncbi:MAG: CDP-archaeol synthase [Cyanobacteria bacterium NC_groundwater_1444_Ag_S-0.65um_54_12]|nr:CDP-archaeol synthase [Cyanobacteria bacterium NC_groundwater_1444_Ag_S-0.65um_54_12]
MITIGAILWLALPMVMAGAIHMGIVKRDIFPRLRVPVDGHLTFRGKRLFGDHKTWRGFLVLITGCMVVMTMQFLLALYYPAVRSIGLFDYTSVNPLYAGAVLGLGYALGELPNSFLKRQLEIAPGVTASGITGLCFLILDQADSVLGCLLLLPLIWVPSLKVASEILGVCTALHLAFNASFFLIGIRKRL